MLFSCVSFALGENENSESATDVVAAADAENTAPLTQEQINKNATGFTDVSADDSYAEAVKKLLEYGIVEGYEDGTFRPYGDVTRAEMCKMINLTRSYTDFEGAAGFTDVTSKNWYYVYALVAQKTGYVEGYEDGSFRASNNITRQEVCAILNRILKPMNLGIPVTISDKVANWARPHVEVIVQNYIMPLEENNTFRATENLKRHELATILANIAIGPVTPIDADVRFFINGEQYTETQTVAIGGTATAPEDPVSNEEGYEFVGWKPIGGENIVDIKSEIVYKDVDYEALFDKKTYTVTFMSRGAEYDVQKVTYNSIVNAPENPTVKGYEFLGWSLTEDGETTKISATKIVSDTVFYAVFAKESSGGGGGGGGGGGASDVVSYSVKFFVNGDTHNTQTVNKNSSPKLPTPPTLDGYVFEGWSLTKDGEIVDPKSVKVTSNVTFYAVFTKEEEPEPVKYTVTFYVDSAKYDTQTVEEGTAPEAPQNPTKDGYNFKGWSKSKGSSTTVTLSYCKINADTSFYAVFEKKQEETKYFTVSFYSDGSLYDSVEVEDGKNASAPASPKKDGYTFKGWSKTDGGKVVSVNSVEITQNTSFYAVFEKNEPKKYSVIFFVNSSEYDRQTVEEGAKPTLPTDPTVDGYSFKGWSKTKSGNTAVDVANIAINAETSYYAILEKNKEEPKKITVTFMVGSKKYDTQTIEEGEAPSVPDDPEAEDGYEFLGWSKTENGTTVNPDKITLNKDTTYYAVFQEKEPEINYFTVIFWWDGEYYKEFEVAENDTVKAPTTPSLNSGESFLGWSTKEDGKEKDVIDVSTVKITKDTDFYSVLIKNPNDPELMTMLNRAYTQLNIRTGGLAKQALNTIRNCVKKVINDANAGEYITKNYILDVYEDDVEAVRKIVNEDMTSTERSNFVNTLTNEQNIDKDVQDFLIDYFDIDTNI